MRISRALPVLLTVVAFAALPSPALSAGDASTTRAYVQADLRLVQHAAGRIPIGESAIHGVLSQVRSECPLAAAGSPQDAESTELSNEVIGAMVVSAIRRDVPSIHEYLHAAAGLRWSSRGLTRQISGYASQLRTLVSLSPPPLCADVRAWAASGFHALSASTRSFSPRFMTAWVALGELPASLGRFESGEVRGLAARASGSEQSLSEFEAQEVSTWGTIMNSLELHP